MGHVTVNLADKIKHPKHLVFLVIFIDTQLHRWKIFCEDFWLFGSEQFDFWSIIF